jgi:hypothetical protein|nr:hypothetical protein [uncultured Flavobacterium sp.]
MKKAFLILFFLINPHLIFSQEYEFTGLLKLNKTTIISYHLSFTERDGKIIGHSLTDLGGDNETKNKVEGFYNKKTNEFSFTEKNIIYSKSKIVTNDFCYLSYTSKLKLTESQKKISGKFKSFFKDGKSCLNGQIDLVEFKKAKKRIHKMNSKIQNSKLVPKEKKDSINLDKMLDELTINKITKDQVTSVYWDTDELQLEIWDANQEDGDEISITVNDRAILKNYKTLNTKKHLTIKLDTEITSLKITANSVGRVAPNTAKISIKNAEKTIDLVSNLEKNETTTIQVIKDK